MLQLTKTKGQNSFSFERLKLSVSTWRHLVLRSTDVQNTHTQTHRYIVYQHHTDKGQTKTGWFVFVPPCSEKSLFTSKLSEIRLCFFCTNWETAALLQIKDILLLTAFGFSMASLSTDCAHKGWVWRQNSALETAGLWLFVPSVEQTFKVLTFY